MSEQDAFQTCLCPRQPPYRKIHKALRLALTQCLARVGSTDPEAGPALLSTLAAVDDVLDLCASHLKHEDRFMHPPLRQRCPELIAAFDAEHAGQHEQTASLQRRVGALRNATSSLEGELQALYLALSLYVAGQLSHMAEEETRLTEALWSHFSDAEISTIEAELVAAIEPAMLKTMTDWMLCGCHHPERLQLLQGMRDVLPEAAVEATLGDLVGRLGGLELGRLRRALYGSQDKEAA